MKITDAENRIDKRCIIALKQNGGIFDLVSKHDKIVPAYVFEESNKIFLQLFFHKKVFDKQKLLPIFSREDFIEKREYYSIVERINNIESMKEVSRILDIPSAVMTDTYVLRDELILNFRFHSSMSVEFNRLLSSLIEKSKNFRIVQLSESLSLRERMSIIDRDTPLSIVRFSIPIPEDTGLIGYIIKNHPDAVAEMESRRLNDEGVRVLIYTNSPVIQSDVKAISKENRIYEAYESEKTLMQGRKKANEARIPRIAFFLTIENGRLMDTTFVPTAEADEYISILMSITNEKKEVIPILEYYSSLTERIWNWL